MCIPERLRCNLEADCPDGEDERNCPSEYFKNGYYVIGNT